LHYLTQIKIICGSVSARPLPHEKIKKKNAAKKKTTEKHNNPSLARGTGSDFRSTWTQVRQSNKFKCSTHMQPKKRPREKNEKKYCNLHLLQL